jgi:hypothetical protein
MLVNIDSIVEYIRPLRGGSQPFLARASDGKLYVVKFKENPQGQNVLLNECVGNELYRLCGLSVPEWTPLRLTPSSLKQNKWCWPEDGGVFPPTAGLCFGSRFLCEDSRLYEILPGSSLGRVRNRDDFWLAWLIDVCAGHGDNRQALFLNQGEGGIDAVFIDHGHMFGGTDGIKVVHPAASRYLDFRIYEKVSSAYLRKILQRIQCLDVDCLWRWVQTLPPEWQTKSALQSISECLNRMSDKDFVACALDAMAAYHRQTLESKNDYSQSRPRLPDGVLHAGILCAAKVCLCVSELQQYAVACNAA